MSLKFLSVTSLILVCATCRAEAQSNIAYSRTSWNGALVHVVHVNLNSPDLKVTVSLTRNGSGSSESFRSMLDRLQPAVAITGTFFCTRSLRPTGDIVIEGARIHDGSVGTGVCFTPGNTVEFMPFAAGRRTGWQGYDTVLCAGPTLVRNGSLSLMPRAQGFTDPALFGKKKRTALGVTSNNKLLLVVVDTPVYLRTLAKIMLHLGAVDAVDLDGGSSSALYCDRRLISRPSRNLTNLLVVYDSLTEYHRHKHALAPQMRELLAARPPRRTRTTSSQFETIFMEGLATGRPSAATTSSTLLAQPEWLTDTESPLTSDSHTSTVSFGAGDWQFPPYKPAPDTAEALLPIPSDLSPEPLRRLPDNPGRKVASRPVRD